MRSWSTRWSNTTASTSYTSSYSIMCSVTPNRWSVFPSVTSYSIMCSVTPNLWSVFSSVPTVSCVQWLQATGQYFHQFLQYHVFSDSKPLVSISISSYSIMCSVTPNLWSVFPSVPTVSCVQWLQTSGQYFHQFLQYHVFRDSKPLVSISISSYSIMCSVTPNLWSVFSLISSYSIMCSGTPNRWSVFPSVPTVSCVQWLQTSGQYFHQFSAHPQYHGHFSLKNSGKTPHSLLVRARYGVSFTSAKSDRSFTFLMAGLCALSHHKWPWYIESV